MTPFQQKNINGKSVYLVEDHHHALLPWAYERDRLGIAPHVLTLDHHTDTLPAFTHYDETHEKPHEKQIANHGAEALENETLARYYARALETEFLSANLERAPLPHGLPFILDIDLDYFKGEKSIKPEDSSLFRELIRKSAVITIARERDWVRLLNMDYGKTPDFIFERNLLRMISGQ